jgi:hypothetical protein
LKNNHRSIQQNTISIVAKNFWIHHLLKAFCLNVLDAMNLWLVLCGILRLSIVMLNQICFLAPAWSCQGSQIPYEWAVTVIIRQWCLWIHSSRLKCDEPITLIRGHANTVRTLSQTDRNRERGRWGFLYSLKLV